MPILFYYGEMLWSKINGKRWVTLIIGNKNNFTHNIIDCYCLVKLVTVVYQEPPFMLLYYNT